MLCDWYPTGQHSVGNNSKQRHCWYKLYTDAQLLNHETRCPCGRRVLVQLSAGPPPSRAGAKLGLIATNTGWLWWSKAKMCSPILQTEAGKGDHRHIGWREQAYKFGGDHDLLSRNRTTDRRSRQICKPVLADRYAGDRLFRFVVVSENTFAFDHQSQPVFVAMSRASRRLWKAPDRNFDERVFRKDIAFIVQQFRIRVGVCTNNDAAVNCSNTVLTGGLPDRTTSATFACSHA